MTTTSQASSSLWSRMNWSRFGLPISSSPSKMTRALIGSVPGLRQVRLERLDVHEQLALVVGRPAREQLVVANRRLERRRDPQVERVDGLHVVVPVEEHRRRARRVQPVAVDDRVARRVDDPHVLEADRPQLLGRPLGAPAHVGGVLGAAR